MNLCHDCNSSYAAPGTCNCFAPGGKRNVATVPYLVPFSHIPGLTTTAVTITTTGAQDVWFNDAEAEGIKS